MSKEEYLALAAARYDALQGLQKHEDFYSYEAEFDKIWTDLGRKVLEGNISEVPQNHRKKTSSERGTEKQKWPEVMCLVSRCWVRELAPIYKANWYYRVVSMCLERYRQ